MKTENEYARWSISPEGKVLEVSGRADGLNYAAGGVFAKVKKGGRWHDATGVRYSEGRMAAEFGEAGVEVQIGVIAKDHYWVWEVETVSGAGAGEVEEMVFCDMPLTLKGDGAEPMGACALALNLQTRVDELPGFQSVLRARCYPRFGLVGARVGLVVCPREAMRGTMKDVLKEFGQIPYSTAGGAWALDGEGSRGSYLFNFGDVTEETVDSWIGLIGDLGFKQLDFHGGKSFRFGDCKPDETMYPQGLESLKRVIDKLHGAGIQAGLHTYAMFLDKKCPWVTPVPDARLGYDRVFTLAKDLNDGEMNIEVNESTEGESLDTGFFVRNSVTLRIGEELVTYKGIRKEKPFAFLECKRGANGTKAQAHAAGEKAYHLKECFGLFVPDGDSTLLEEVAAKTAETYNTCGFDMIYLDALDGSDIFAGAENYWHYSAKFTYAICERLKKPAVMEMSTFNHHLWFVRSRLGAWDHPNRSHKRFIDLHCRSNAGIPEGAPADHGFSSGFLPMNLGWWALKTWEGPMEEPTYPDDLEYLCGKALGYDFSLSLMGINPENYQKNPYMQRTAKIFKDYETLRLSNYFPETVKRELRKLGAEFTLKQEGQRWRLYPVEVNKHKVERLDGVSNVWTVRNRFGRQPMKIRITALTGAGRYEDGKALSLAEFGGESGLKFQRAAKGVTGALEADTQTVKAGDASGHLKGNSTRAERKGSWIEWSRSFAPDLDMKEHSAMGLWVHGDGKGEILNVQLQSPAHFIPGIGEHYIPIDFTGWRYFELIEPEGERYAEYVWPYGNPYSIYRENVTLTNIQTLSVWLNHLPANETAECFISPIRALPTAEIHIERPELTVGGKTVVFPVTLATGEYLEYNGPGDCRHYDKEGRVIGEVALEGEVLEVQEGDNAVEFQGKTAENLNLRAQVAIFSQGGAID